MSIARSAREAIANAIDSGEFVLQGSQEELISHEQAILKYADRIITRLTAEGWVIVSDNKFQVLRGQLDEIVTKLEDHVETQLPPGSCRFLAKAGRAALAAIDEIEER